MTSYQHGPHELTEEQARLVQALQDDARNRYADGDLGALRHSIALKPYDPAYKLLLDGKHTTPEVHRDGCYICEDPEFAAMGLPLCKPCPDCVRKGRGQGHIAADDAICDDCGYQHGPWDYGKGWEILPEPRDPQEGTP